MLYELVNFSDQLGPLNVFRYITFRTGGAIFTALIFVLLFGPGIIDLLRVRQGKGQPIRSDGPQSHLAKRGTPTMGGLMILSSVLVSTLLWANLHNMYVWIVLAITLTFGLIGFYDDYLKVTKQTASGFSGRIRLLVELAVAGLATYGFMQLAKPELATSLTIPFFKNLLIDLGPFFILLGVLVIAGAGNAVNPDGRARRTGYCAGNDRRRHLRADCLSFGQLQIRELPADSFHRGNRRTSHYLRSTDWCRARVLVVQRSSGHDLYGRHRISRTRGRTGLDSRGHQA